MNTRIDHLFKTCDQYDPAYKWWSRPYEYWAALGGTDVYGELFGAGAKRVHNAACGPWKPGMPWADPHVPDLQRFWRALRKPGRTLILSDLFPCDGSQPCEYCRWDMLTPWEGEKQDVVLCISALEHLDADYRAVAEHNLFEQLSPGGVLIITQDEPVPENPPDGLLTGANSIYPQPEYAHLCVRLRVIRRDA